jgi:subtilase family serine protease
MSTNFDQVFYVDFDGAKTAYYGEAVTVNGVEVVDSGISTARIAAVLDALNETYAASGVSFVSEKPQNGEYSTIYVGKSGAFDAFGDFKGISETIDAGNAVKDDNAFVLLDKAASNAELISTISHEADHLLGTLDHGGNGLDAYGAVVFVGAPDLKITKLDVSSFTPTTDDSVKFTVTVKNIGTKDAGVSRLYLYEGTKKLGGIMTVAQAAGVSKTYTMTLAAGKLTAGTHKVFVQVDPLKEVEELDENNNKTANRTLTVAKATRDLQITSLTASRSTITKNDSVNLTFKVHNAGNASTGSSKVYVYDKNGVKLGGIVIESLAAGASKNYSYTIAAGKLASGSNKVKVVVDPGKVVAESNESNNTVYKTITVESAKYDLQVKNVAFSSSTVSSKESVKLTFDVYNASNTKVNASKVYVYDKDGKKLIGFNVPTLAYQGSKSFTYTIPAGKLPLGTNKLMIKADASDVVKESNETNNAVYKSVKVVKYDMVVSSVSVSQSTIAANGSVKFTVTVKNAGNVTSKACKLYFYDSAVKKLGGVNVAALAAGKSAIYTCTIAGSKLAVGSNSVIVKVDASGVMKEVNESNNKLTKTIKVTAVKSSASAPLMPEWNVVAYEDVNNDGFADLLLGKDTGLTGWENPSAGQLDELSSLVGDEWKFGGVADWNNDSVDELLLKGCAVSLKPETDEQGKILGAGKLA